jgi:hypothetical protein
MEDQACAVTPPRSIRRALSAGRRERYRTVMRTQPIILHVRRSLNSNAERT